MKLFTLICEECGERKPFRANDSQGLLDQFDSSGWIYLPDNGKYERGLGGALCPKANCQDRHYGNIDCEPSAAEPTPLGTTNEPRKARRITMELFDARGNRVDTSDTFTFTPPSWWDEGTETNTGLRGRFVEIKRVVTYGQRPTVELKSHDREFAAYLRKQGKVGFLFPVDWLTLWD